MKEATGELNMAVVSIVAIAILSAFFFYTIWPMIRNNMDRNTKCSKAICEKCTSGDCQMVKCYTLNKDGTKSSEFECVWKG